MSSMTMKDVRDWHRSRQEENRSPGYCDAHKHMADVIAAHLAASKAQMVDVERVISRCRELAKRWIEIDGVSDEHHTGLIQAANELCYRLDAIAVALPRE